MEKKQFEISFNFLHIREIGYFEIADLDELCRTEHKTKNNTSRNRTKGL